MAKQKRQYARPFIKWACVKTQLISQLDSLLPSSSDGEDFYTLVKNGFYTTYIEPFVGSGAMLFYMLQQYPFYRNIIYNCNNTLKKVYPYP